MIEKSYKYIQGRRGEVVCCAVFSDDGWGAIPTAELSGPQSNRAPVQLHLETQNVVLPDFDISKLGQPRMWLEAKTKGQFFEWRKTRRFQTGIELRLLDHYRRMEETTQAPVVVCMIDKETGDVLANTISALGPPRVSEHEDYPIANWDRERFVRLRTVNPERLRNLIERKLLPGPITRQMLRETLDYLRPQPGDQGELHLFHSDVIAEWVRLQRARQSTGRRHDLRDQREHSGAFAG